MSIEVVVCFLMSWLMMFNMYSNVSLDTQKCFLNSESSRQLHFSIHHNLFRTLLLVFSFLFFTWRIAAAADIITSMSSQRCSVKKCVLENFTLFTGKHLCWSLSLIKRDSTLLKRDSNTGVFLWLLRNSFKNTYFEKDLRTATSSSPISSSFIILFYVISHQLHLYPLHPFFTFSQKVFKVIHRIFKAI